MENYINNDKVRAVNLYFGKDPKLFNVIENPYPHILSSSVNKIDGWNFYDYQEKGRRECTQERLSVRCYAGCPQRNDVVQNCMKGCSFCYTQNFGGYWNPDKVSNYFQLFWQKGIATVYINQAKAILKQINGTRTKEGKEKAKALRGIFPLYHSTTTDPFNELEGKYRLTKETIENTLEWNVPNEFITKMGGNLLKWKGYDLMIEKMASQPHSFAQFTIYAREDIRAVFSSGSSPVSEQFKAVKLCADKGLFTIVRIDPIIPYISDNLNDLSELIENAKHSEAKHIIASVIDIPKKCVRKDDSNWFLKFSKLSAKFGNPKSMKDYETLFSNNFKSERQASNAYREDLFSALRELCKENGLTFSLCMEFKKEGERYIGYNDSFMTSIACEGMEIPMYYRDNIDEKFYPLPLTKCDGNCLGSGKQKPTCKRICNYMPFIDARANPFPIYQKFRMEKE